jgi:hypothetical protein
MAYRRHHAYQSEDYTHGGVKCSLVGKANACRCDAKGALPRTKELTGLIEIRLNVPIGTGARQHLVDAEHVEWVSTDADVEGVLTNGLHEVLVAANAASLKSLRRNLRASKFNVSSKILGRHKNAMVVWATSGYTPRTHLLVFVGDQVHAERELIDTGTLATEVKNADLGVRDTTAKA